MAIRFNAAADNFIRTGSNPSPAYTVAMTVRIVREDIAAEFSQAVERAIENLTWQGLTEAISQVATAAASEATPSLAQFGQAAIEAAREIQRLRVSSWAGWGVDGARDDCDCIFCQEYRDQHRDPAAQENARTLLLSCLTPAQQEEYQASKSFTVKVRSGNRYRIETRRSYNVVELDKRYRPRLELCAGPVEDVPLEDQMLAQKLLLETDEAGFLAVANGRPVSRAMEYVGFGERMGYR